MIQLNLLPEVKIKYIKTEKIKATVQTLTILLSIIFIVITGLFYGYTVLQKNQITNLSKSISQESAKFSSFKNINNILTVQNQISAINTLKSQTPNANRLTGYLNEIIPVNANISTLNINFQANTIVISGNADTVYTINLLVDSLKSATFSVKGVSGTSPAFSSVILSSVGNGANSGGNSGLNASYSISFNFNPILFNQQDVVYLTIPTQYATRSEQAAPVKLFSNN